MSPHRTPIFASITLAAALPTTGVAIALALALPGVASGATLTAAPAADFRASIGVNTHMRWTGTPYGDTPVAAVQALIKDLGVIRVRDTVCTTADAGCLAGNQRLADLYDSYGSNGPKVRLDAQIPPLPRDDTVRSSRDAKILQSLKTLAVTADKAKPGDVVSPLSNGMLDTLEGTNEPDLYAAPGQDWAATAVGDSAAIRAARSTINGAYGVTALNFASVLAPANGRLSNLAALTSSPGYDTTAWSRANIHPYPGVGTPERAFDDACNGYPAVPAPGQPDSTPPELACVQAAHGRTTIEATETGYHNYTADVCNPVGVSQAASGIYTPRIVLENFRRGVSRTYLYELLDLQPFYTSGGHAFGLVSATTNSSGKYVAGPTKQAYAALKNTLSTIGDLANPVRLTGSLDVTVGTTAAPTVDLDQNTVRKMLLRRGDGSYVLALWQPKSVGQWRNNYWACTWSFANIAVPAINARVTLGTAGQSFTVERYTPNTSASPVATTTGRTLDIPIGAGVTLLSIR